MCDSFLKVWFCQICSQIIFLKNLDKKLAQAAEELQDAQPKRESGSFVFDEDFFFRILGFVTNTSNLFYALSYYLANAYKSITNCCKRTDLRENSGPDMKENVAKTLSYNHSLYADPEPQPPEQPVIFTHFLGDLADDPKNLDHIDLFL